MKRKSDSYESNSKNVKKTKSYWKIFDELIKNKEYNTYVSGTEIKNYLLNDNIVDYLKYTTYNQSSTNESTISTTSNKSTSTSTSSTTCNKITSSTNESNILFDYGIEFENVIINNLRERFQVTTINTDNKNGYTPENILKTKNAMIRGDPIIYQGVLIDYKYGIGGCPDLIVKGYILNQITNNYNIQKISIIEKPYIQKKYENYYYIIDIKWTTIPLCVSNNHIRNEGLFVAYKGQLAIYNYLIGLIQEYTPDTCYILGKGFKSDYHKSNNEHSSFTLLGIFDYSNHDESYIEKTYNAIKWIHELREGKYNNIKKEDLFRMKILINCKNSYSKSDDKMLLAKELGEITQIWNVSNNHKEIAHSKGLYSIFDENLTAKEMGISGQRGNLIDGILEINRTNKPYIIVNNVNTKDTIYNNDFKELINDKKCYFVDFETINFADQEDVLFMIGVGHINNEKWEFKQFIADDLSIESERKLFIDFLNYIEPDNYLYHWSNAEISIYNRVLARHIDYFLIVNPNFKRIMYQWIDLYNTFINYGIIINNSYNFKLKNIGNSLFNLGLINTKLDDNIVDGLDAMIKALKYYKDKENKEENKQGNKEENKQEEEEGDKEEKEEKDVMNMISKYNEIDCILLYEIRNFIINLNSIETCI